MKTLLIGVGAAGNKAVMTAIEKGIHKEDNCIMVNSTSKDFPAEFKGKKIVLSPYNTGCGKERTVAKDYTLTALKSGKFDIPDISSYTTVVIATSVEGGTGSGATPILAKFFNQVPKKNVHIMAFIGFEEDVRGLSNTIEFFQEIDSNLIVHAIRNVAFLREAGGNKFKAEQLANVEMAKRLRIITGQDFINSEQNIDDTDILKVSNTSGYMTVEHSYITKALVDQEDFNKLIKKMIYESKSIQTKNPGALRLGVILNIDPSTEDAIDYSFADIKKIYGNPFESFLQKQWDNDKEYIAFIVSGMQMPLEELKAIFARYKEETEKVNKDTDSFFKEMQAMELNNADKKFDMIKPVQHGTTIDDFMKQFETK